MQVRTLTIIRMTGGIPAVISTEMAEYQEQIQIHFYDKETGKEQDSTPAMGREKWNGETNKYEYSYEVGSSGLHCEYSDL